MDEIGKRLDFLGERFWVLLTNELKRYSSLKDSRILNDPNAISWEINEKSGEYELIMRLPDYAVWIDQGRGPNKKMPPSGSIRDWMKRKGIPIEKEFVIRKTIGIRGIKPRPFLDASLNKFLPEINEAIENTSRNIIISDLDKIIKKINI